MSPKHAGWKSATIAIFIAALFVQTSFSQETPAQNKAIADFERRLEHSDLAGLDPQLMNFAVTNPNNVKGLELLARLRFRQGRLSESRALYQRVLQLHPGYASARISSARVEYLLGHKEESLRLLSGIREAEVAPGERIALAAVSLLVHGPEKTLSIVESLPANLRNTSGLPLLAEIYRRLNRRGDLIALLPSMKKAAVINPTLAIQCGEVLQSAGLYKEAIQLLSSISATARNKERVLLNLTRLEVLAGNITAARKHLAAASRRNPNSPEVLSLQAYIESLTGNMDAALGLATRARERAANSPTVLADFVALTLRLGKANLAFEAAKQLIAWQPENTEYQYLYGVASLQSGNLESAHETLVRYVQAQPGDFRGCLALGMVLAAQRGQVEKSRAQLRSCSQIDPANSEARYQLGLSYKSEGDNKQAIEMLSEAVRLSPNYSAAVRDLGALHLESGDDLKARSLLERAAEINPKDAEVHFQLARLYNRIGESALAKKHQAIFQNLRGPWGESTR